jgi:transcriptional regulator with XRE-family HTH domain
MTPDHDTGDDRVNTRREAARDDRGSQSRNDSAYSRDFAAAIGRTIKVIRTDLGIERRELATAVGISYSYLTEIENGNKPASSTVLRPIAHALGLRLSQLTEAAELRLETRADSGTAGTPASAPAFAQVDAMCLQPSVDFAYAPSTSAALLGSPQQSAMRPSLRGQYRELRDAILELEHLLERMAPDDVERLLDYARRLAR